MTTPNLGILFTILRLLLSTDLTIGFSFGVALGKGECLGKQYHQHVENREKLMFDCRKHYMAEFERMLTRPETKKTLQNAVSQGYSCYEFHQGIKRCPDDGKTRNHAEFGELSTMTRDQRQPVFVHGLQIRDSRYYGDGGTAGFTACWHKVNTVDGSNTANY